MGDVAAFALIEHEQTHVKRRTVGQDELVTRLRASRGN